MSNHTVVVDEYELSIFVSYAEIRNQRRIMFYNIDSAVVNFANDGCIEIAPDEIDTLRAQYDDEIRQQLIAQLSEVSL